MASIGWNCTSLCLFLLFFLSSVLPSGLALSARSKCYTGNGTVSEDIPCYQSADVSFCCGVGWSCLSNGLCQFRDSTSFAEGTCTDETYPINACLGSCLASGNEDKTIVHNCGGSGAGDTNKWCCAGVQGVTGEGEDCCSTKATTTLESFPYSTVRVIKAVSRPTSASSSSPTPPSSPSSTPPSSSLSTTSSSASLTTQQPLVSDPSKASPLISPTEALPPSATAIQQPSDSRNIAIGAGVGVPLGILALGATAMLLYRDRRVKKQIRQLQEHLRTGSEIPLQQNVQGEAKAPSYVYGEAELETGIDRAELRASDQSHEAPGRQLYEMR